jgi:aryl-alcohol dehydrogenase-like predicted oxidoreductase
LKLALGGAQFGTAYGIGNRHGRLGGDQVRRILATARAAGITMIDTAPAYGESEAMLGSLLDVVPGAWEVVTKVECRGERAEWNSALSASASRLGRWPSTLLCHRAKDWILNREFREWLLACRTAGKVERVGVSVYDPDEADAAQRFGPDVIQAPLSVLDQRLVRSGVLRKLADAGVLVHVRSVFLQGLLFLNPNEIGPPFAGARPALSRLRELAREHGLTVAALALAFVHSFPEVTVVIVGVERAEQLAELMPATGLDLTEVIAAELSRLECRDTAVIDPRLWPRRDGSEAVSRDAT